MKKFLKERLTIRKGNEDYTVKAASTIPFVIKKLGIYEDSIEQGTLLQLPCKIGDIVYQVDRVNKIILTKKVLSIDVGIGGFSEPSVRIWFETAGGCFGCHFGKTVFFDRAEALRALEQFLDRGSE